MRVNDIIDVTESLNSEVPVRWKVIKGTKEQPRQSVRGAFKVMGHRYFIQFTPSANGKMVTLTYGIPETDGQGSEQINTSVSTGLHQARAILSTVVKNAEKFMDRNPHVNILQFSGAKSSDNDKLDRSKMYTRLLQKFVDRSKYLITKKDSKAFSQVLTGQMQQGDAESALFRIIRKQKQGGTPEQVKQQANNMRVDSIKATPDQPVSPIQPQAPVSPQPPKL